MFTENEQLAVSVILAALAVGIAGAKVYILTASRHNQSKTPSTIFSCIVFSLAAILCVAIAALDIIDLRNFRLKEMLVYGPKKIPYRMTKEPFQNHLTQASLQLTVLFLLKLSFLSVHWSIRHQLSDILRKCTYFSAFYILAAYIVGLGVMSFWCFPTPFRWDGPYVINPTCDVFSVLPFTVVTFTNVSADLLLFGISFAIIYSLNLHTKNSRLALLVIFSIGFLTIFAACARYYIIVSISHYVENPPHAGNPNAMITFGKDLAMKLTFWNKMEALFGILTYGIFALRSVFRFWSTALKKLYASSASSASSWNRSFNRTRQPRQEDESQVTLSRIESYVMVGEGKNVETAVYKS